MAIDETGFEGTLVLECLAERSLLDAFYEAVDADDFKAASSLMKKAGIDAQTIAIVLKEMADADGSPKR